MDDSQGVSLTEHQRRWLEHLRACEASGKGIAAYASEHGIDAKAMYAGKKVLVKKGVLPRTHRRRRFQRAQLKDPVAGSAWRIQLPNGLSVAFSGAVDARTLSTVLTTAAALD
jgi:hypothetical protein